ncbi:MAG TPA: hypothetical protein VJ853_07910 [Thermoanaerobaculia bacterium]|nr:hypothetical protein [Thermoanaerobaculia bacterium]
MRSLAIFLLILLVIVGGVFAFLVFTTPHQSADFHARLDAISQVPASAQWFAIIPTAAALDAKLQANPVTRAAIERWRANQPLPKPWMIGGADLIVWKSGDAIRYFIRVDPFRGVIVRTFLTTGNVMINVQPEQPLDTTTAAQIAQLASKLPPGDALVVQRENARGSYPPISRPSVTSVQVTPAEVRLTSVAAGFSPPGPSEGLKAAAPLDFPKSAILSVGFKSPPRLIADLNRLFGTKVSDLLGGGGMLCIYNVDTRKFLPRPLGVIVLPDSPQRRAEIGSIANTATKDGNLLVSFDRDSIGQYQNDTFEPAAAGNEWTARIDPPRLVPILNALKDSVGLRILAPRLYRSARDLEGWISGLEQAKVIDASDSVDATGETLRVRIPAK